MSKLLFVCTAVLICLLLISCGTVSTVRPLRKGNSSFAASLGGPVAEVSGINIPIPYLLARYRYGINDKLSIGVGSHLFAATMGIIGLDAGASHHFLEQSSWVPSVGVGANLYTFYKAGSEFRVFPELELTASYLLKDRFLTYASVQSMFQLTDKPHIILAPVIGEEIRISRKLSMTIESKWYAPSEATQPRVVDYTLPISNHGAVGFVLGVNYHLGGWYE